MIKLLLAVAFAVWLMPILFRAIVFIGVIGLHGKELRKEKMKDKEE